MANDAAQRAFNFQHRRFVLGIFVERCQDLGQNLIQIDTDARQFCTSQAAVSQQVGQEPVQMFAGADDSPSQLLAIGAQLRAMVVEQDLRKGRNF